MTSIAAFLASLTGGAPLDGQKTTPANALGGVGIFASLLNTANGEAQAEAGLTENTNPLGLLLQPATPDVPLTPATTDVSDAEAALGELLTQGLAQTEGDVEAQIVEAPITTEISSDVDNDAATTASAPLDVETDDIVAVETADDGENSDADTPDNADTTASAPPATPASTQSSDTDDVIDDTPDADDDVVAGPVTPPPGEPPVTTDQPARTPGLANAFERASDRGRENGLVNALNRAPQAKGPKATGQPTTGDEKAAARETGAKDTPVNRPQTASTADDVPPPVKQGQGRPEFAVNKAKTVQRILDTGNGKSVIQIHERAGGETAGTASPPTLTVNVSASAASPGPVSPNTPHVPVSALAVHIAQQHKNGARRFDIRLDPPELGRIEVRLDVSRDGQVTTHLVVERSETLDLLQRDARQLERALQNAGLNTSDDGMKFSLKDQGLAQGGQDQGDAGSEEDSVSASSTREADAAANDEAMPPPVRYLATSGLDIRI